MPIFDKFSNQSKPFWATFYERYHQYFENPATIYHEWAQKKNEKDEHP